MSLQHDAMDFKLLDSDPKIRPTATKEFRSFKNACISIRLKMAFDRVRARDCN